MVNQVRKRSGKVVKFNRKKITNAILKAMDEVGSGSKDKADKYSTKVTDKLDKKFKKKVPSVEEIQDIVEEVLIESKEAEVAKAYILYRQAHKKAREEDVKMSINAMKVLERRYLKKDADGHLIETPTGMFRRVAHNISLADEKYNEDPRKSEKQFYQLMVSLEFMPNSPTLMNAGSDLQQLAACFVLPVDDSIEAIFDALKYTALIHKSGGGTGFGFSRLRPKNDMVLSTKGVSSGPVSFMTVFDAATEAIKQGGTRRGANMGILRIDHPDVLEFITCKRDNEKLTNFNISVAVTDDFMKAVEENREFELLNPRNKKPISKLNAADVFDLIATLAWKNGDPGIIFIDRMNEDNPTPELGEIESTNPCGEQPLLPYESCNLGSINLANMIDGGKIDYGKIKRTVHTSVHFLDNVIDMNRFPLKEIKKMVQTNRKIGLGIMGFADMIIQLAIAYNSEEAVKTAEELMSFINEEAKKASEALAKKRGTFPAYEKSIYKGKRKLRNATTTTVAPTGTISIIANCSSGIEPLFAVSYIRTVMDGTELLEVNPNFEKVAIERGFYSEELMKKIARTGTVNGVEEVPEDVQKLFVTAHDISPEWHIKLQAAFQKHTDNAVSKTVNFRNEATVEDVKKVYLLAYKLGCKGVTVYRDGSKDNQVLTVGTEREKQKEDLKKVSSTFAGGCEDCDA